MPSGTRTLAPGIVLTARYKGQQYTCEVVLTEAGVRYRLADGREFKSLSAAGQAVTGAIACNGPRFWSLARVEKPEAVAGVLARTRAG